MTMREKLKKQAEALLAQGFSSDLIRIRLTAVAAEKLSEHITRGGNFLYLDGFRIEPIDGILETAYALVPCESSEGVTEDGVHKVYFKNADRRILGDAIFKFFTLENLTPLGNGRVDFIVSVKSSLTNTRA